MKVSLIDPPRIVKKNVRTSRVKEPDIAFGYFATLMKRQGHEVFVTDAFAENITIDDIGRRIKNVMPDIIGIPLFTFKVNEAAAVASIAKSIKPDVKVVVGGAHATALPEQTLMECADFDFLVIGEGERTFEELAGAVEKKEEDLSGIRGLAWRAGGEIKINEARPLIEDLDSLGFPDWNDFPLDLYFPLYHTRREFLELPVSSARGCVGRCSFCFRLTRGGIRARSADSVVSEIERDINQFGAKSIIFFDESFSADPARTHAFCDEMISRGVQRKITWLCETRVDTVDPELLSHMKEAGCIHVSFGVESGCQEILDKNGKKTTVEQAYRAVSMAKKAGLQVDTYYILGLPYDNRATMLQSRRFAVKSGTDFANFFILVPYPGTVAMRLAEQGKANLKLLTKDWSEYGIQIGGAMELQDMSRDELERFQFLSYLRFYLRPSRIMNMLRIVSFKAVPTYLLNIIKGIFRK